MFQELAPRQNLSLDLLGSRGLTIPFLLPLLLLAARPLPPSRVKLPSAPGSQSGVSQTGIASWYGPGFHGKATASGVIYDQNGSDRSAPDITPRHPSYGYQSQTGSATEVTINDRGPFAKGRIIDLSYGAGKALGMIGPGTIPVHVEVIDGPNNVQSIRASLDYTLQLGSFSQIENAQQLRDKLKGSYADVSIVPLQAKDVTYYRVQLGTFSNRNAAEEQARLLSKSGFPVIIMEK